MPYIIIACIILAVGAAAEIIAYVFTDKLLKKREEGLNRREADIQRREDLFIATPKITAQSRLEPVKIRAYGEYYEANMEFPYASWLHKCYSEVEQRVFDMARNQIRISREDEHGKIKISAELWVVRKEAGQCLKNAN